jgi:hypothetical protein
MTGLGQNFLSNIGTARNNRVGLLSSAGQNYTAGAAEAFGNAGEARANGIWNTTAAINGGLETGFGLYGRMGGTLPMAGSGWGGWGGASAPASTGFPMPATGRPVSAWSLY